ncbi:MAG TPA: hypothetical protein VN577_18030 [Terriglobales bacterium]|nr:hypothetical protein [Terriglobales bacterium]
MLIWTFYEFVHGVSTDRGIISTDMPAGAQAELDVILSEELGRIPYHEWGVPSFKPLGHGMGEIRFKYGGAQYRVFGALGHGGGNYNFWMVATKNRKRKNLQATDPPNAIETAHKRKSAYELRREGRLRKYDPSGASEET